jgi:hypothetical protein
MAVLESIKASHQEETVARPEPAPTSETVAPGSLELEGRWLDRREQPMRGARLRGESWQRYQRIVHEPVVRM